MKNIIKNILLAGAFILFVASPVMTVTNPQPVNAAACGGSIIGIPPWYRGLSKTVGDDCVIVSPDEAGGLSNFIWRVVLNGIEMALVIVSYIALFFILYGGFLFITGGGNASQIEKARKSIFGAVIGLIISLGAIAITNVIFNVLIGGNPTTTESGIIVNQISADQLLKNGLNLVYYIVGILAVVVIVLSGLSYVTSAGDSGKVTRAKNMILYAVVGLVVVIAAYAITNFVILRF